MNEFIIVFRETLEASLIVGIIYTILIKNELYESIKKLWIGVAAALVFSILVGYLVYVLKESFSNESARALFESVFMFITAGLIWYVIFWLSKHVSDRKQIEAETNTAVQASTWGIFFVIFFSILREGFETAIFLLGSFSMTGSFSYLGFTIGAALAILIGSKISKSIGFPVFTSQNAQALVHVSPIIIKVACFLLQHSVMFGQFASWQTVTKLFLLTTCFV